MKPLRLSMTAFGPYKDKETIDFTELNDNHLFVISGATGAGKTTIFDGICFALYGTASGTDRENIAMLRSHFADDDVHTAVEFIFELNDRTYRVLRQLGHIKEGNKTKTGDRYEFFEQLEDGTEVPRVDRQIVSEINDELEAIIGLTQDQFKQIVMLPQGEFRKLLTSETENKEAILRRLFKTERYRLMHTILKEKKEDVNRRFLKEQQMLEHHIQSIHATLKRRENSNLFLLLEKEFYNVEQILTGLEEEIVYLQEAIQKDKKNYEDAIKKYEQQQAFYHEALKINEQLSALAQKKRELAQLQQNKIIFLRKEQQLAAAERASQLEPYEHQVIERRKELLEKENYFSDATKQLEAAKATYEHVKQVYVEEEKKEAEREKLTRDLERYKEFLPTVREMDETKQKLQKLKDTIHTLTSNIRTTASLFEKKEAEADTLKKGMAEKESRLHDRVKKQDEVYQLREQYRIFHEYSNVRKKQWDIQKKLEAEESTYKRAEKQFREMETKWFQNQAAVLASHLHQGDECPVCGSLNHPNKAIIDGIEMTKEELDAAKRVVDEKQNVYQAILADYRLSTEQLKELSQEVVNYGVALEHVEQETATIVERGQQLKREVAALDQLAKEVKQNKLSLEKLETDMKQIRERKEQDEKALAEHQTEFTKEDATFKERIRQIPEEMQDLQTLQTKMNEMDGLKNKLEQQWKEVQERLQQADKAQTTAQVNVANGKIELEKIRSTVKQIETLFTKRLTDAQFENEEMYTQAKMSEENRQSLQQEIETYKQQTATLQKQIAEWTEELKEKEKVDVEAIERTLTQLKSEYESAFELFNASKNYYNRALEVKENILHVQAESASLEKELASVTDLYDVLRGQNIKRISFERYLQIDYLDQITAAANERFKTLTNGQFYLIRSDRQETHGRQSGLALDVYDAYTGQTRDVKTLSGGEKFIASLCLALGMSDVIQSFQGSISMDTMFIDEGFGSLDEESLHKSIDALISLQQTGRMIGVISHVEELKTIFPAMLEVTKTKEGYSETKFVLK